MFLSVRCHQHVGKSAVAGARTMTWDAPTIEGLAGMGIIAFCPRGHRVKVKDELGGRKGICPECQASFRIPPAGTALPVARVVSLDAARAARLPRADVLGSDDLLRAAGAASASAGGSDDAESDGAGFDDLPADAFEPLDADPPAAATEPTALHPAIAERPELAWCVAVPGGQPSPPFDGPALQRWLEAGSATGTEVVWRADWAQWVPIRTVFPQFMPDRGTRGDAAGPGRGWPV